MLFYALKIETFMNLTNQVEATKEQFLKLVKEYPKNEPVVMVNLLKFKPLSGVGDEDGATTYARYSKNVFPLLMKAGGKLLWSGMVNQTIIGDATDQPHMVIIAEYPSVGAFIDMATSPEYDKIKDDRILALEFGGLLAAKTMHFYQK